MAHSYFCTHCGKRVDHHSVLFDMGTILLGSAAKWGDEIGLLQLRVTETEIDRRNTYPEG